MKSMAQVTGMMYTDSIKAVDNSLNEGVVNWVGRFGLCSFKADNKPAILIRIEDLTILELEKMNEVYNEFPGLRELQKVS